MKITILVECSNCCQTVFQKTPEEIENSSERIFQMFREIF
ncbi:hypothetical protein HMPREF1869_00377 [Bacteroidales bacterium KA00251]|nr:hypothetical protein HMPREF1869_00377 [Bacteroidales bacterium KA00251]